MITCESPQFRENLVLYRLIILFIRFCNRPRNSLVLQALQPYSLLSEHNLVPFFLSLCPSLSTRERIRILSFYGSLEVSDWFPATSQPRLLDSTSKLGSKPRDETVSHRVAWNPLKLLPRRQFRLFRDPLSRYRAAGQLSGAICIPGSRPRAL